MTSRSEDAISFRVTIRPASWGSRHLAVCAAALVLTAARLAVSYSPAPPIPSTGAPNEPSTTQCIHCHNDAPLDSGGGTLSVSTGSDSFSTGLSYTVTVHLAEAAKQRWGFEVVARTPDGQNAGFFGSLDSTTSVQRDTNTDAGLLYAYQSVKGTFAGQPSATWTLAWTAPTDPAVTQVTFYAAGVAADGLGDSEPAGDDVYQTTATIALASTATRATTWGRIKALYRDGVPSGTPRSAPRAACTRPTTS